MATKKKAKVFGGGYFPTLHLPGLHLQNFSRLFSPFIISESPKWCQFTHTLLCIIAHRLILGENGEKYYELQISKNIAETMSPIRQTPIDDLRVWTLQPGRNIASNLYHFLLGWRSSKAVLIMSNTPWAKGGFGGISSRLKF